MPYWGNIETSRTRRTRWARLAPAAAVALCAAAFAAPASAAIVPPSGAQELVTFSDSNIAIAGGLTPGNYDVKVVRGGTVIGEALNLPSSGALEVNHGPELCWDGPTPDILAGDRVQFLNAGTADGIEMIVGDVTIGEPSSAGGTTTVSGTTTDNANLVVRLVKGLGDAHFEAPGDAGASVAFGPGDAWTATFNGAVPGSDAEARIVNGNAITIAEPSAANACGPVASSAMTSLSRSVVNIAQQGPIDVVGVVQPGVGVQVSLGGVTRSGVENGNTWRASFNATTLAGLAEGAHQITATFTGGGAPGPQQRTILKDLTAPGAPGATPAPGTYPNAQSVSLLAGGDDVFYTNGGGAPTTPVTGPIPVTATQTLRAVAVDAAGNPSPEASFAYVIAPPQGGGGGGGGQPVQPVQPAPAAAPAPAPVLETSSAGPLSLGSLVTSSRVRRSRARSQGLRLVMRVSDGTQVVRVRVYRRKRDGSRSLLATGFRSPNATGLFRVRLSDRKLRRDLSVGSYEIQATPGTSRTDLGSTSRYAFRVVGG